jgi:hypothetical protein
MSLSGLGNLTATLLNQLLGQGQTAQPGPTPVPASPTNRTSALPEDRFTPSAQNSSAQTTAQEAGLFQIAQFSTVSLTANFSQTQAATPPAAQNAAPAQVVQPAPAIAAPQAAPKIVTLSVAADFLQAQAAAPPVAQNPAPTQAVQPAPAIATPQATAPLIGAATSTETTAAEVQHQLQTLNTALANLGLSNSDIGALDRVATLIKEFNPVAYSSLVSQLKALAWQATPPATAPAATAVNPSAGANANGGTFQVQELAIKFSGAQGTANGNGNGQQAAGGNNVQFSAFNLQVEDIRLTLTNNTGQTVQVQAPQPIAGPPPGVPQASQTKAAAA